MYATKENFTKTLHDLKTNKLSLNSYINDICVRIEKNDAVIQSLLPEANRRERLIKEAEQLEKRYPIPAERPPLYGMLAGIKDVIRADGFPTKAGSPLPADEFAGPEAEAVT